MPTEVENLYNLYWYDLEGDLLNFSKAGSPSPQSFVASWF